MFKTLLATRISMLFSMMFGRLNKGKKRTKTSKVLMALLGVYVVVAEHPHLTVGYALLETRNCTPFNIVRDAAAFLLCEGCQ